MHNGFLDMKICKQPKKNTVKLDSIKSKDLKLRVVANTCNPSNWEAEVGGS
jgi:hypothetical protein